MNDYYNLTNEYYNTQVFFAQGTNIWQTWEKPRGCKFVNIFMLGGGGGGAGGRQAIGCCSNKSGGGGGGSSAVTRLLIPAFFVPDRLSVLVGIGGVGGTSGGAGSTGGSNSYIGLDNSSILRNTNLLASSTSNNSGGLYETAGNGNATSAISEASLGGSGILTSVGGLAGGIGGTFASGASRSVSASTIVTGGAGGGAISGASDEIQFVGGGIIGNGFVPSINGGIIGGGNGINGYSSFNPSNLITSNYPLFFTGGSGGGANNVGVGGIGGDGAFGCGGGGGGCGNTAGGRGGRGGNGLVIITCW